MGGLVSLFGQSLLFIMHRVLCCFIVYKNAKRRELDNPVFWGIVSLFTGVICVAIYFLFNVGIGNKQKPKKTYLLSILSCICVGISVFSIATTLNFLEVTSSTAIESNTVFDKHSPFEYVTYDKVGNEYNLLDLYDFNFWGEREGYKSPDVYSKDGKKLATEEDIIIDSDGYGHLEDEFKNLERRKLIKNEMYYTAYFDEKHNIYYDLFDCSWDKNGNLIFKDKIFEKLTYENTEPYNEEEY